MYRKINDKNVLFPTFLYYPHKKQLRSQKFVEIATVDRIITRKGRKEKERRKKSNRTEEKCRTVRNTCQAENGV
jgi:hypothetical protein